MTDLERLQCWIEDGMCWVRVGNEEDFTIKHLVSVDAVDPVRVIMRDHYALAIYSRSDGSKEKRSLEIIPDCGLGPLVVVGPPIAMSEAEIHESMEAET